MSAPRLSIRPAAGTEMPLVLAFIRELAQYEHLEREVVASETDLSAALGGERPYAEVLFACLDDAPVGFALFFHNFSTFLGKPGLYLEDLFVRPAARGHGVGRALLAHLARLALERGCPRLDWAVLDWNAPAIEFYRGLGARALREWNLYRLSGPALEELARR
ncbi:MAG: GNAT family N-acetyltransferase [Gammaproteobacteria bacterium]|nr:GNAT family N-acetyltransferase [Gammaproteobacteria bacterium]MBV9621070.1 GNAT family N-acetyltransferase [Gammaproteobacteria bacterium]